MQTRSKTNFNNTSPRRDVKRNVRKRPKRKDARRVSAKKSTKPTTSRPNINALPDVVLIEIFARLSARDRIRVERVCRKWSRLSKQAWHNFKYMGFWSFFDNSFADSVYTVTVTQSFKLTITLPRSLHDVHLKRILCRCRTALREIDLSGYRENVDYRILPFIGQHCPNIESINLTGIVVTNSSLCSLAIRCKKLKVIVFQRCFQDSVLDRGLSCLFANCQNLQALNFGENERITGRCFVELPATLKSVKLSTCLELLDEGVVALADRCPDVEILHLDNCPLVTEEGLQYALSKLSRLQVLRLGEYYATAQGTQLLFEPNSLLHLRELYLNDNCLATDNTLESLSRSCKNLSTLDLSTPSWLITDAGISHLCCLENLNTLNLSFLSRITDLGVVRLAKKGILRSLRLNYCQELTDFCALQLAQYCSQLINLELNKCPKISDITVWAFFQKAKKRDFRLSLSVGQTGVTLKNGDIFHPNFNLILYDAII